MGTTTTTAFTTMLKLAMTNSRPDYSERLRALDFGVNKTSLLRYASGDVSFEERQHCEHVILNNSWGMKTVIDLLRRRRLRSVA